MQTHRRTHREQQRNLRRAFGSAIGATNASPHTAQVAIISRMPSRKGFMGARFG